MDLVSCLIGLAAEACCWYHVFSVCGCIEQPPREAQAAPVLVRTPAVASNPFRSTGAPKDARQAVNPFRNADAPKDAHLESAAPFSFV